MHGQGDSNINYSNFTNRECDKTIIVATRGCGGGGGELGTEITKIEKFELRCFPLLHLVYISGQEVLISIFYQPYI